MRIETSRRTGTFIVEAMRIEESFWPSYKLNTAILQAESGMLVPKDCFEFNGKHYQITKVRPLHNPNRQLCEIEFIDFIEQ